MKLVHKQRKTVAALRRESRRATNRIFSTRGYQERHLPVAERSVKDAIEFNRVLKDAIDKNKEYEKEREFHKRVYTLPQRVRAALRM